MKIAVVLGTRPEIIKMSPIIRALEALDVRRSALDEAPKTSNVKRRTSNSPFPETSNVERQTVNYFVVHTGQHYSYNMDKVFFEQLKLPEAKYNLEVGSGSHAEQTAKILTAIEKVFLEEKPDVILVQGDTNTVLAGALAASKLHIKVGHVEAGLRSYDRQMPEEINRILTDHCSDYLFAPTEKAQQILLSEGIPQSKIFVTGNTIVDAVYQNLEIANANGDILDKYGLKSKSYFLVTLHRQENVDDPVRFKGILEALKLLTTKYQLPVIYPIHPRSLKMMQQFGLSPSPETDSSAVIPEASKGEAEGSLGGGTRNLKLETENSSSTPSFRPEESVARREDLARNSPSPSLESHKSLIINHKSPTSPQPETYNLKLTTYNTPLLHLLDPVDFFSFLQLEKHARLILTDSGGVQEESCILGTPCVTLRDNTERPETLEVGASLLAGASPEKILECCYTMLKKRSDWKNPFGDGKAGERVVKILEQ